MFDGKYDHFEKHVFLCKNYWVYFLSNFIKFWATFHFNIWSHWIHLQNVHEARLVLGVWADVRRAVRQDLRQLKKWPFPKRPHDSEREAEDVTRPDLTRFTGWNRFGRIDSSLWFSEQHSKKINCPPYNFAQI